MLHYVNRTYRDYGNHPVPVYPRSNWEFQAVLRGRCGPSYSTSQGALASSKLWAFGPNNRHGWFGLPGEKCEIVVFHFDSVPKALHSLIPDDGVVSAPLAREQSILIRTLSARCSEILHRPGIRNEIVSEHALLSLCLIIVELSGEEGVIEYRNPDKRIVSATLSWYEENMARRPRLTELAERSNVSVSKLRRVFHEVLGTSPQRELLKRRLDRAKFLLSATGLSASEIAYTTGYGSLSTFSRVFTAEVGTSPALWRRGHDEVSKHFV